MSTTAAYYPPPAFAFSIVVVPGPSSPPQTAIDGAFAEVSGIDPHVETEEVIEGGINSYVHQFPGVTKHSNLVLKRGYVVQQSALAQWAAQTVSSTLGSPVQTQTLNVNLLGSDGEPMVTWTFSNAWPVKWEVGTFDASDTNKVLMQTIEFSYTTVTSTTNSNPSQPA